MAERIFCRAGPAVTGFRPGANPSIRAVGLDLAFGRQAAFSPLAGVASITSSSRSSISCMFRRSVSPRTARRRSISRRLASRRLSAIVVKRSIRSTTSSSSASAFTVRVSMLTPAPASSLWITLTARRFAPHVPLREFFGLVDLCPVQNVINGQTDAVQNLVDLVDGSRFIPGTRVCQRLRSLRPDLPQDCL